MDAILKNFKQWGKGWVIDYVRIGIICYLMLTLVFIYAFLI